jgi:hypothetical protein
MIRKASERYVIDNHGFNNKRESELNPSVISIKRHEVISLPPEVRLYVPGGHERGTTVFSGQ